METQFGKLEATRRTTTGKGVNRKLRRAGRIPAVVYGEGGPAESITVDPNALLKSLDPARRGNTVLELTVTDGDSKQQLKVMLKDYQSDALRGNLLHADFVRVHDDTVVNVDIPLRLTGKSVGIVLGGKLYQVFRKLPVACKADSIPAEIVADVTALDVGSTLSVSELPLPAGVTVKLREQQTVAHVSMPRGLKDEEETTDTTAVVAAAPAAAEK